MSQNGRRFNGLDSIYWSRGLIASNPDVFLDGKLVYHYNLRHLTGASGVGYCDCSQHPTCRSVARAMGPHHGQEEVHVRRLFTRAAATALCVTVAMGAAVVPCAAADAPAKGAGTLARLSPASRAVLKQQAPAATGSNSPFFKTTKGKVTLALMGAGVGFTVWSISHDRKPVKSPIR
jgi:hypothetical protein